MDPHKPNEEISESNATIKAKRDEFSIEIRKKRKEDFLNAKRLKFSRAGESEPFQEKINSMEPLEVFFLFLSSLNNSNIPSILS